MFILFGTRQYGQVDKVPGLGAVSTRFFHVQFFPLIPLATYFVPENYEHVGIGMKTRLSIKSIVVAWCRATAIVGAVFSLIIAVLAYSENDQSNALTAGAALLACLCVLDLLRATKGIGRASEAKEAWLRERYRAPDWSDYTVPESKAA